jgi:hypothetical protein
MKRLDTREFIIRANKIHEHRYDYSLIEYKNVRTKIKIICRIHGEFFQTPSDHLYNKAGCNICADLDTRSFIQRAQIVHKNKFDYSNTVFGKKVSIVCPAHGLFLQNPHVHLRGSGCPKCCVNVSKSESAWLDSINIPHEHRQKTIIIDSKKYKVDAYDSESNTVYEFYGDFWHGNLNRFNSTDINRVSKISFGDLNGRTQARSNKIRAAGYNLIEKWETE